MGTSATRNEERFKTVAESAEEAAESLKVIANPLRLQILCHLAVRAHTVQELEELLGVTQSNASQQLAKLRDRGIVECRRDGRNLVYSIKDERFVQMILAIKKVFCPDP